jgi:hypothetical protein
MNLKSEFTLSAEAITNGEGKEQEQLVDLIRENDVIFDVPAYWLNVLVLVECPS